MPASVDVQEGMAEAFSALRSEFFADNPAVKLLKEDPESREFNEVGTLSDWFFEYSNYREAFKLEIAQDSAQLTGWVNDATHLSVGSDVYVINQSDTLPPKGTDFTWKLFCTRHFSRNQISAVV